MATEALKPKPDNQEATTTKVASATTSQAQQTILQNSEKRLFRHRSKPTIKITERIQRAISQKLYLINTSPITTCPMNNGPSITFHVLGSTGNIYDVTIRKLPSCTCPDHLKGNLCKHILFVLLKVIGLHPDSNLVYQAAYVTVELNELIDMFQQRQFALVGDRNVTANEAVQAQYAKIQGDAEGDTNESSSSSSKNKNPHANRKEISNMSECPICFDLLGTDIALLTFCQGSCGNNFHAQCIKMWTSQCRNSDPTCPACRQLWIDPSTGGKRKQRDYDDGKVSSEGYANLGALQGQSQRRDTSTYRNTSPSKWRRYY